MQHPGGAQQDRRQRQSVAVHLISLCLRYEFGQPPERALAQRGKTSWHVLARVGMQDWPFLLPPSDLGAVTVRDVHVTAAQERAGRMQDWARAAWTAWAGHHDVVRPWAAAAWEQGR